MFENIDGVVYLCGDLYAKTPKALSELFDELRRIGYKIEDLRKADCRNVSVETMEKDGYSLWNARLDIRRGKCGSCQQYINTAGIASHGNKCSHCGAVTYLEIDEGSCVRFSFIKHPAKKCYIDDIRMTAHKWDTEAGFLYLYPEVMMGLWLNKEGAKQYFEKNKDKWEEIEEDGKRLIRIKCRQYDNYKNSVISINEVSVHYENYKIVNVWEGKEYGEYCHNLPVPESIKIFESWHWAPLESSPNLHNEILAATGNVPDKGWYYQDGRGHFSRKSFQLMGKFIRNFTSLDADKWDIESKNFRSDGPGGIDDIANFCHPNPQVENRPNVGNLIIGFSKAMSGQELTSEEKRAMEKAAADRKIGNQFFQSLKCEH